MQQQAQQSAQAQQSEQSAQAQFVPLTGPIIASIVDLIYCEPPPAYNSQALRSRPIYTNADIIINVYKAFECFVGMEAEDALWDYKKNIQHFIADYIYPRVMQHLNEVPAHTVWHNSTDREVMYFYDVLFGNPQFVINNTMFPLRLDIAAELFECHYYLSRLQHEDNNHNSFVTIQDIPVIRLLEEALYNKSTDCINCLMQSGLYNKYMPLYIYLKHSHNVWGKNERRSLADSDMLFELLLKGADMESKSLLLEIAIGGLMIKHTTVENLLRNVVNPNLALVKKMVPDSFPREKEMISLLGDVISTNGSILNMRTNEFSLNRYAAYRTPYAIWTEYLNRQFFAHCLAKGSYEVFTIPRNAAIGEYLRF